MLLNDVDMKRYKKAYGPDGAYANMSRSEIYDMIEEGSDGNISSDSDFEGYTFNGKKVIDNIIKDDRNIRSRIGFNEKVARYGLGEKRALGREESSSDDETFSNRSLKTGEGKGARMVDFKPRRRKKFVKEVTPVSSSTARENRARAIRKRRLTGNKRIKDVVAARKRYEELKAMKQKKKEEKRLKALKREESDIDVFADSSDEDSMMAKNMRALALG